MAEEFENLKHSYAASNKRITSLQEELKAKPTAPWGGLSGLKDMIGGKSNNKDDEREVLFEELEHKIREAETLHAKVFDLQQENMEMKKKNEQLQLEHGNETTTAVSRISYLEEELRIAKGEESRLAGLVADRTEELAGMQSQLQASTQHLQDIESRFKNSSAIISKNIFIDTSRRPDLEELSVLHTDLAWSKTTSTHVTQLTEIIAHIVRGIEALFSNATERIHILLSKASAIAGPVKTAALRLLKDALRKANTGCSSVSKTLLESCDAAAAVENASYSSISKICLSGSDDDVTLPAVPAEVKPAEWVQFLIKNIKFLLNALFEHSPAVGDDEAEREEQLEEVSRLTELIQKPLTSFVSQQEPTPTPSQLRQIKAAVKEFTEAVTVLFAREVKVAWELAGFDGVNKRILAGLNALHGHLSSAVDLRHQILSHRDTRGVSVSRVAPFATLLPPQQHVTDDDLRNLPPSYWSSAGDSHYKSANLARTRLHKKAAMFMRTVSEATYTCNTKVVQSSEDQRPSTPAIESSENPKIEETDNTGETQSCGLLEAIPTPTTESEREIDYFRQSLQTADSKAVRYRIEWERCFLDLEARAALVQNLQDDNRDLQRRLRNRDIEVKNMSHGYTDQMRVFQDRIVDLENRLATASSGRGR
eukprot:TRINITY_DN21840_c0_g2_i2.p1 TRINITY_DN21840_c0_g2~~TRINITY_DN21840_c0_g2_i2.p1  ORF type:complete len:732 (+),score=153.87 TRINITY_DN21840_c0_g2_i2:246-2198(+)